MARKYFTFNSGIPIEHCKFVQDKMHIANNACHHKEIILGGVVYVVIKCMLTLALRNTRLKKVLNEISSSLHNVALVLYMLPRVLFLLFLIIIPARNIFELLGLPFNSSSLRWSSHSDSPNSNLPFIIHSRTPWHTQKPGKYSRRKGSVS